VVDAREIVGERGRERGRRGERESESERSDPQEGIR
jgi:hypothetical protein